MVTVCGREHRDILVESYPLKTGITADMAALQIKDGEYTATIYKMVRHGASITNSSLGKSVLVLHQSGKVIIAVSQYGRCPCTSCPQRYNRK